MLWFLFILALLLAALWLYAGEALLCLLQRQKPTRDESSDIPSRYGEAWQRHRAESHAWHVIIRGMLVFLIMVTWVQRYFADHDARVALRDSARMRSPPFQCMDSALTWDDLTFAEKYAPGMSHEERCDEYIKHYNMGVWPDPISPMIDFVGEILIAGFIGHVGHGMYLFVSHFGPFLQVYVVTLIPVIGIALLYIAPTLACLRPTPKQYYSQAELLPAPPPLHKLRIEDVSAEEERQVYERLQLVAPSP